MPEIVEIDAEEMRAKSLVSWVMNKVDDWEDHRVANNDEKFKKYYRLYRGIWDPNDKTRDSERSKLISPALQQAVEATVAELEEATFGKGVIWFDLFDDIRDEMKDDMNSLRVLLADEMEEMDFSSAISRVFLNGAVFGTGIAKLMVMDRDEPVIQADPETGQATTKMVKRFRVGLECINPMEFAVDPSARTIDEALGCAHIIPKPKADIMAKQEAGIYNDVELGSWPQDNPVYDQLLGKMTAVDEADIVKLVEYHGKVPRAMLPVDINDDEEIVTFVPQNEVGETSLDFEDGDLVEAIVTVANNNVLLKAVENTSLMGDRAIIAYQHDTVNESFWGRGVCEKGFNAQKALDAELRARIDAMAFASAPMMAADATRLPRASALSVRPGKLWLTTGRPDETFMPMNFSQGNQATFHQAGDLERMVQMATGAMDSASPLNSNPRNQTASGMSMMQSAFIKRSKRTMQNISRQFLDKVIKRSAYRYMQFDPDKFPPFDPTFKVAATMGIAAREFESAQLTQMMQIVPPDNPAFSVLMDGLIENTSLSNKQQLKEAIEASRKPDPNAQKQQQIALESMATELEKLKSEIKEINSKAVKNLADAQASGEKNIIEVAKIANDSRKDKANAKDK